MEVTSIENQIVSMLSAGDVRAMDLLYDHYSDALYGVTLRIVGNEDQAKDVLQDAFIKIWKKSKSYDSSKGRLFTWLISIVRNQSIDAIRKNKREGKIYGQSNDVVLENKSADNIDLGLNHDIKKVLAQLDEHQKELLEHSYILGYTHPEIAEKLELPIGTVKTRIRSAMIELRTLFSNGH